MLCIGIILAGTFQVLQAQTSATASFTASATIIQPIGITTTANMNFAHIDAQEGGAVILTPQNTRMTTGGVALAGGEDLSAATFTVTGQPGLAYSIQVPTASYTLTNGIEEMIIENFTSSLGNGGLLAEGKQEFNIGATLKVNAGQTPGYYTSPSPMDVTVIYN
ncbi:MAG TPA: DUF4402 domain-containing protein [Gillisia sp.]|nr:DUF4402 domain-containing protein [Gillisia sp.]